MWAGMHSQSGPLVSPLQPSARVDFTMSHGSKAQVNNFDRVTKRVGWSM